MVTVLAAADLDRTLIYSHRAAGDVPGAELVCVEWYADRPTSFVHSDAVTRLAHLCTAGYLVPVTTRTVAQLARVTLPGAPPRHAVAANGGVLLVDGVVDRDWSRSIATAMLACAPLAEVLSAAETTCDQRWTSAVRVAEDLFCYAVIDRAGMPADFVAETSEWASRRGWRTSLQGRKLYWVPETLTKSAAVAHLRERLSCGEVVAAGDSLLDIDLLEYADRGIRPAHGEIFEQGWHAAHVRTTVASGAAAGVEIVAWLHGQCVEPGGSNAPAS